MTTLLDILFLLYDLELDDAFLDYCDFYFVNEVWPLVNYARTMDDLSSECSIDYDTDSNDECLNN